MMDANGSWILLSMILVVGVGLVALVAFSRATFSRFVPRHVALPCPETGTKFEGIVEKDLVKGTQRVATCARFDDPSEVTCHQRCLKRLDEA